MILSAVCSKLVLAFHENDSLVFFSKLKSPLELHCYCDIWPACIGKTNGSCPVCGKTKPKKSSYFIVVPLLSTLSSILTSTFIVFISFISLSHYQANLFMKFLSHYFFWSNFYKFKHITVCSYHVMYVFQSESTLCICLNVKELPA